MRTYRCDRCGEKFAESGPMDSPTHPSADLTKVGLTTKIPILGRANTIVIAEVDLCGSCVESLVAWAASVRI